MQDPIRPIAARRWGGVALLLGLAACVGCGNGLARVEGVVTLDGEPIAAGPNVDASICFYPEEGGNPSVGHIDDAGRYYVTSGSQVGLPPGAYLVTVRASEFKETGNPNEPRPSRLLTPRDYINPNTSNLRAEVETGSNEIDFELVKPVRQSRRGR